MLYHTQHLPVLNYHCHIVLTPAILKTNFTIKERHIAEEYNAKNTELPPVLLNNREHISFPWCNSPLEGRPPHYRGFTTTIRHTTLGTTPLDKRPVRCWDLHLTAHNTHKRQTSVPPEGLQPAIAASKRLQSHALDRADNGIRDWEMYTFNKHSHWSRPQQFERNNNTDFNNILTRMYHISFDIKSFSSPRNNPSALLRNSPNFVKVELPLP